MRDLRGRTMRTIAGAWSDEEMQIIMPRVRISLQAGEKEPGEAAAVKLLILLLHTYVGNWLNFALL